MENSENCNEDFEEMHVEIEKTIGKEKLHAYLKDYNRGLILSFISFIDEGNNWRLVKMALAGH